MALSDGTRHLTSLRNEYMKRHVVYDGDGNPTHVFEARPTCADGEPCFVTKSEWTGGLCVNMLEYEGVWDSDWDLTEG